MALFEIRILLDVADIYRAEGVLDALGDILDGMVGFQRYGTVLFEGVNPNGTEVPVGFEAPQEGSPAAEAYQELSAAAEAAAALAEAVRDGSLKP